MFVGYTICIIISPRYPRRPAIGIYLTICYATTLGGMISPIQDPNCIIYDVSAVLASAIHNSCFDNSLILFQSHIPTVS